MNTIVIATISLSVYTIHRMNHKKIEKFLNEYSFVEYISIFLLPLKMWLIVWKWLLMYSGMIFIQIYFKIFSSFQFFLWFAFTFHFIFNMLWRLRTFYWEQNSFFSVHFFIVFMQTDVWNLLGYRFLFFCTW